MRIRKVVYVDHSFHIRTTSTQFVVEILRTRFDVDVLWDDSWQGGEAVSAQTINASAPDAIVFFQILYEPDLLNELHCKNLVYIPMYDGSGCLPDEYWLTYRQIKFLNFSSWLHQRLLHLGLTSHYLQYYPDPHREVIPPPAQCDQGLRGFFWQRMNHITWTQVRILVENTHFSHFHLHTATDPPGYDVIEPTKQDQEQYHTTVSDWFENPDEYLEKVASADVYFAPRAGEGIGQAFLEAMQMGKCVVCPDRPTMNEYVQHGENGLLYDPIRPQPLDFSRAHELGRAAAASVRDGRRAWLEHQQEINDIVEEPVPEIRPLAWKIRFRVRARELVGRFPRLQHLLVRAMERLRSVR